MPPCARAQSPLWLSPASGGSTWAAEGSERVLSLLWPPALESKGGSWVRRAPRASESVPSRQRHGCCRWGEGPANGSVDGEGARGELARAGPSGTAAGRRACQHPWDPPHDAAARPLLQSAEGEERCRPRAARGHGSVCRAPQPGGRPTRQELLGEQVCPGQPRLHFLGPLERGHTHSERGPGQSGLLGIQPDPSGLGEGVAQAPRMTPAQSPPSGSSRLSPCQGSQWPRLGRWPVMWQG